MITNKARVLIVTVMQFEKEIEEVVYVKNPCDVNKLSDDLQSYEAFQPLALSCKLSRPVTRRGGASIAKMRK